MSNRHLSDEWHRKRSTTPTTRIVRLITLKAVTTCSALFHPGRQQQRYRRAQARLFSAARRPVSELDEVRATTTAAGAAKPRHVGCSADRLRRRAAAQAVTEPCRGVGWTSASAPPIRRSPGHRTSDHRRRKPCSSRLKKPPGRPVGLRRPHLPPPTITGTGFDIPSFEGDRRGTHSSRARWRSACPRRHQLPSLRYEVGDALEGAFADPSSQSMRRARAAPR